MKILVLMLFVILPFSSFAKCNVVFIGLSGDGAPSLEKGFESLLREKLSMEPELYAKDFLECQKFRRAIRFDDYAAVPMNHLESLLRFGDDSMLVVWGTVKNYRIDYQQKKLIFTGIKGELQIGLYIYSLLKSDFLFIGDVSAEVYQSRGIGFLKSKQTVSAKDRAELIGLLQSEAATNSYLKIIEAFRAEKAVMQNTFSIVDTSGPSISDVFSIPSTEPAQIESTSTQKNDTLKGSEK
ncbi:MAG: hypothetical protein GX267_18580 [Fibrobacter sp.]|jgi:hypothetical protein|nr:hypothetical protein [Fibrobacter sp.]